ncbi:hypothetical protein EVG20_g11298 [Dentipellis fragilis]|uniref:Uncharacterized protein n=1 Tax=Dentipellis fragilis TaxID=205917 RepID=A0A4Y9XN95_9AGAM|nr:hypothetical protein EVG20_g11298 [Dentipellis fragilis]
MKITTVASSYVKEAFNPTRNEVEAWREDVRAEAGAPRTVYGSAHLHVASPVAQSLYVIIIPFVLSDWSARVQLS